MKNQALFSLKDKSKKLKCCPLQFLFGALRVKYSTVCESSFEIGTQRTLYILLMEDAKLLLGSLQYSQHVKDSNSEPYISITTPDFCFLN